MKLHGVLGNGLSHSLSPILHAFLGDADYGRFSLDEAEARRLITSRELGWLNVTKPYKLLGASLCDRLSDIAAATGSVNIIKRGNDGLLYGFNTDYIGFEKLLERERIEPSGMNCALLGNGGAARTLAYLLKNRGAELILLTRADMTPNALSNSQLVINATSAGMYPNYEDSPISLECAGSCGALVDIIYNPLNTSLMLEAREHRIKAANGLYMLAAQGVESRKIGAGEEVNDSFTESVYKFLLSRTRNLLLIGMPSCGKTALGRMAAEKLGMPFVDCDEFFTDKYGASPASVILSAGETHFRKLERDAADEIGALQGCVIASGGGAVTDRATIKRLCRNAYTIWLGRDITMLSAVGRPLSGNIEELYAARKPLYETYAEATADCPEGLEAAFEALLSKIFAAGFVQS